MEQPVSQRSSTHSIKKTQLDEVRQLARPPTGVQKTMTAVAVMIGRADPANAKSLDWADVRKVIRADDFQSTVVAFRPEDLTEKAHSYVRKDYLSDADIDADTAPGQRGQGDGRGVGRDAREVREAFAASGTESGLD